MEVFSASQSQVAAGSRRCKDAGCDMDQDWPVVLRVNLLNSCEDPNVSPARLDRMLSCSGFSKSPVMPASYHLLEACLCGRGGQHPFQKDAPWPSSRVRQEDIRN